MSAQQDSSGMAGLEKHFALTEEEKKVLAQCNSESLWFRSIPLAAIAMFTTKSLISRGLLTASSKYGQLPKLAFAGFMGYMAGKISYINACKEKIMKLENSPMAERLRREHFGKIQDPSKPAENDGSQFAETITTPSFHYPKSSPPAPEPPSSFYSSEYKPNSADVPFSASMSESSTTGISDNLAQAPEFQVEEQSKPPPVTYEELRNKNRGAYDVLKPQTPSRPIEKRTPKIEAVKKNKYGDVWED